MKVTNTLCTLILFLLVRAQASAQENDSKATRQTQSEQKGAASTASNSEEFLPLKYFARRGEIVYFNRGTNQHEREIWSDKLRFTLVEESSDTVWIRFKKITKDPPNLLALVNVEKGVSTAYDGFVNKTNDNEDYYFLKGRRQAFTYHYKALVTGTIVLPIKIRLAFDSIPMQASPDVSIGPYVGYQFGSKAYASSRESRLTSTLALFAAPGLVSINSSNSNDSVPTNTSAFGLSAGIGYLAELNSFQIGLVTGYDWVFGDSAKEWIYQPFEHTDQPWISIAIGFKFRRDG